MQKIKQYTIVGLCILLFASCQKEEKLWTLPPTGEEKVATVEMGENYDNAIFFSLKNGKQNSRNYDEWDLAFSCADNDFHIILNGGKAVQVYNTKDTAFSKTTFTPPDVKLWVWDNPNGDKDSTAFVGWCDNAGKSLLHTYIIDLGSNASPRFLKLQLLDADNNTYTLKFAEFNNTGLTQTKITGDASRNYVYFNLSMNMVVDFEPKNTEWDLLFTKYRHVYYDMDPITPYTVNGALINTRFVEVIEINNLKFEEITYEKVTTIKLSNKADAIGYNWKYYDLNGTGKYSVYDKKVYLLKDNEGAYYKLKFIGFYNDLGVKGSPKFIYQRL